VGSLGHRGLSGGVRLPSGFGSDHTACEHSERHFFTFIYLLISFEVGSASLADLKERELVRRMNFFDPEGQVPADVSGTAFLCDVKSNRLSEARSGEMASLLSWGQQLCREGGG